MKEDRKLNEIFIHNGSMNFRFLRLDPGITHIAQHENFPIPLMRLERTTKPTTQIERKKK